VQTITIRHNDVAPERNIAAGLGCLISLLSLMLAQWLAGHPFD
jgi:hypothetical protein